MKKDFNFVFLITVFFLTAGTFFTMLFFNKDISVFTRASESQVPSQTNSVIIAWPLSIEAGQSSKITVFVRNDRGNGLADKKVTLITSSGSSTPPSTITDKTGKAEFTVAAPPGLVKVTAQSENITLGNPIDLTFQ